MAAHDPIAAAGDRCGRAPRPGLRRPLLALLTGVTLVLPVTAAAADAAPTPRVSCADNPDQVFCGGYGSPVDPAPGNGNGNGTPLELPPMTYVVTSGSDDDGELCINLRAQFVEDPGPTSWTPEQVAELAAAHEAGEPYLRDGGEDSLPPGGIGVPPAMCPGEPAVDVAGLAVDVFLAMGVQSYEPTIAPGYMLTGLTAYLELDGPEQLVESIELPAGLGVVEITATPVEHHIDWGDGSDVTVTTSNGVPYGVDGDAITHIYTHKGERTVSVTTHWAGTFTAPGQRDDLGQRVADPDPLELPVRELRPVRITPTD